MLIQDLSKELDDRAMSAVHGGDNGNSIATTVLQAMQIQAPVSIVNGAGSASNNFINVNGSQSSNVSNSQTAGDEFAAFLGELAAFK